MQKLSVFSSFPYVLLLSITNPANAEITDGFRLTVYPPINANCPQKDFEQYVQQIGETRIAISTLLDLLNNIPPKKENLNRAEEIAFELVKLSKTGSSGFEG